MCGCVGANHSLLLLKFRLYLLHSTRGLFHFLDQSTMMTVSSYLHRPQGRVGHSNASDTGINGCSTVVPKIVKQRSHKSWRIGDHVWSQEHSIHSLLSHFLVGLLVWSSSETFQDRKLGRCDKLWIHLLRETKRLSLHYWAQNTKWGTLKFGAKLWQVF